MEIPKSFLGYKRENGRAGTRNHVIILPVDDISNACAEAVANNIKGTIALPHSYGRLQFGADLELHFRTMIGTGQNPNVAAVIVIGIEPKWTKKIVDAIATTQPLPRQLHHHAQPGRIRVYKFSCPWICYYSRNSKCPPRLFSFSKTFN